MDDLIQVKGDDLWTTSDIVAREFGRRHHDVMRAVDKLVESRAINLRDFTQITYTDSKNRTYRAYQLTERAFLIAMPFIGGDKAEQGQKRLVDEFLRMRAELRRILLQRQDAYWQQKRLEGKATRLALTGVIQEFVSYAKAQGSQNAAKYYMSITKMEYAALELVKLASDKAFRDVLDAVQHSQLTVVEMACQEALTQGMEEGLHYKDCYLKAKEACEELAVALKRRIPNRGNAANQRLARAVA
ncbi:hypothetical protein AVE30378_01010 [Achromobacter veterisilvae]|uniref:Rha family transcriptional regulator n=1 Tax=Achromobacter veterisilvae TaxID=2069367 RepID=A0A446C8R9_9BURK|nr:Rha family transcriptional regulator [Achromobacter veterisilvae]SSW64308.1 hypothetical protein AVE30378_01010 [Achromobacter veterisilvae]